MANILGLSNGVIQASYQLGGQNALLFHAVSESVPEPPRPSLFSIRPHRAIYIRQKNGCSATTILTGWLIYIQN